MSHKCAMPKCRSMIPSELLMCSTHWRYVPMKFRAVIYREYNAGQVGSDAYDEAVQAAIDHVTKGEEQCQQYHRRRSGL